MKEMNLGRILIENRHKRGITQEELATHIGVSKGAVSKWETNSSLPDISLLPQLASYFDITIDELIGYEPQKDGTPQGGFSAATALDRRIGMSSPAAPSPGRWPGYSHHGSQ